MKYAIELSAAQSARTLELAVRHGATALLEPRTWVDAQGLKGRLLDVNTEILRVEVTETPLCSLELIVGVYCDTSLLLGQDLFMFCTNVVQAERPDDHWHIALARPARLQVCQRRRLWRVQLAESSCVRLQWGPSDSLSTATGRLLNISGDGLACLVDVPTAEDIAIGDVVMTSFSLPGCDRPFELAAVLCNKTEASDAGRRILGMQFLEPASSGMSAATRDLNAFLLKRYGSGAGAPAECAALDGRRP